MLELRDISFTIQKDGHEVPLIQEVTFKVSEGHFMAIVGPSGCGKTTLLKLIAGINVESGGQVCWAGRDLSTEGDLEPAEIGYVPQFSVAYENLTVEENIEAAIRLRARTENREAFHDLTDRTLSSVGLGNSGNVPSGSSPRPKAPSLPGPGAGFESGPAALRRSHQWTRSQVGGRDRPLIA
ncbi:MAG: ATP-binding cassette domain-containing protein [Verrucomicrobiales bacterium]